MNVEVVPATEADKPIVSNLLQLYLHDFSEFDGIAISADARFQYPHFSHYWEVADRHPFLIKVDESLAGFAFVKKGSEIAGDERTMDLAEFFFLRGRRRKGVGRAAFGEIVRMFPGPWVVRVQDGIPGTTEFWNRVIPEAAVGGIEKETKYDGQREWIVFRFAVSESSSEGSSG